ncbi:MAG: dihydropyrimidinase [Oscillospiraceae bacterium]|nr:dihydropyrimidinase [Oscillospiraceae bacterium]
MSEERVLIKNGTVINASGRQAADVAICGEKIVSVAQNINPEAKTKVVDASGLLVLPGAIDVHTHFELPFGDFSSADDFYTGTRAAASGGVTTIMDFVTPEKGESLINALVKRKEQASEKVCIDYSLHMGIVDVNAGIINEMKAVVEAGVPSFKVFMTYAFRVIDKEISRILSRAKELDALIMVHAEDHVSLEALRSKFISEGKTDVWHHYLSRPEDVEAKAVREVVELAKATGGKLYIVHLACAEGLKAVEKAQLEGYQIFAETCPQYLNFTRDVYKRADGRNFVCSPPMKGPESKEALWRSIESEPSHCLSVPNVGINTVATDHCPFQTYDKDRGRNDFTKIPNGVMGVENVYPYMLSEANKGRISFERAVELCSTNPAKIFGCLSTKGSIEVNKDADIVLYDPTKDFTISQENMHSNIDYTIWEGVKLKGYPVQTYSRGALIYKDGEFVGDAGHGRFIECTLHSNVEKSPF